MRDTQRKALKTRPPQRFPQGGGARKNSKTMKEEKIIEKLKSVDENIDRMSDKIVDLSNAVERVNQKSQLLAAQKNILFTGKR